MALRRFALAAGQKAAGMYSETSEDWGDEDDDDDDGDNDGASFSGNYLGLGELLMALLCSSCSLHQATTLSVTHSLVMFS